MEIICFFWCLLLGQVVRDGRAGGGREGIEHYYSIHPCMPDIVWD